MHPGDLIMARTAIQSDKVNDKVTKRIYSIRGPFQIVWDIERGSYIVRKMNKTDSPELKFMFENVYILPPFMRPCKPIDSSDTCHLNQYHAQIVNPF